ncbi:hypothetical protein CLV47_105105 [Antricoccus suffuscus]|uniref:Capsular polysaccharide biosynthesis protein n=1 Tax=Antricoccus suffuscus TaxID=1629062 RepID=A0A2T1A1L2_9ACTN|nr:hypothetical protein [Antricoccus suffuscus]PRZ42483.1 hypothetical protein CLV47_105105 [Antricoccus suffuscus]
MYFGDVLKALGRRWYVLVAGLVVIAVAAGLAIKWVPTQYEASGQMLLLLPADATGITTPTNPYINLQAGLITTASVVAGTLSTKDSQREMKAKGFTSEYAVALDPGGGPLLLITADDTNPQRAVATRDEVIKRLDGELARIQQDENVPVTQLIHSRTFSVTQFAEALPGSKIRALAVIGAVGVILTLIVALMIDRYRPARKRPRRSRARRSRETGPDDETQADPQSPSVDNDSELASSATSTVEHEVVGEPRR